MKQADRTWALLLNCDGQIAEPIDNHRFVRLTILLTSSVFEAAVLGISMRLVKLVLLPCLLLLERQPTSLTSPEAILASRSFSRHWLKGIPKTRPPADSTRVQTKKQHPNNFSECQKVSRIIFGIYRLRVKYQGRYFSSDSIATIHQSRGVTIFEDYSEPNDVTIKPKTVKQKKNIFSYVSVTRKQKKNQKFYYGLFVFRKYT